jgi:hypothetical protein
VRIVVLSGLLGRGMSRLDGRRVSGGMGLGGWVRSVE